MAQASLLTGRSIPTLPCKARSSRPQVHTNNGQGFVGLRRGLLEAWQELWPAHCMTCRDRAAKGCCGAPIGAVPAARLLLLSQKGLLQRVLLMCTAARRAFLWRETLLCGLYYEQPAALMHLTACCCT